MQMARVLDLDVQIVSLGGAYSVVVCFDGGTLPIGVYPTLGEAEIQAAETELWLCKLAKDLGWVDYICH